MMTQDFIRSTKNSTVADRCPSGKEIISQYLPEIIAKATWSVKMLFGSEYPCSLKKFGGKTNVASQIEQTN